MYSDEGRLNLHFDGDFTLINDLLDNPPKNRGPTSVLTNYYSFRPRTNRAAILRTAR